MDAALSLLTPPPGTPRAPPEWGTGVHREPVIGFTASVCSICSRTLIPALAMGPSKFCASQCQCHCYSEPNHTGRRDLSQHGGPCGSVALPSSASVGFCLFVWGINFFQRGPRLAPAPVADMHFTFFCSASTKWKAEVQMFDPFLLLPCPYCLRGHQLAESLEWFLWVVWGGAGICIFRICICAF